MTIAQQKAFLYTNGWVWTGRHWFKKETRKPGKTLLIDLPRESAVEWEQLMLGRPARDVKPG